MSRATVVRQSDLWLAWYVETNYMARMAETITIDPVLAEIEAFLVASNMTPTAFGRRSIGDKTLVHKLRVGRECKLATRARIREFIQNYRLSTRA